MLDWQNVRLEEPCDVKRFGAHGRLLFKRCAWLLLSALVAVLLLVVPFKAQATESARPSLMVSDPSLQRDFAGHWVLKGGVSVSLSPALIAAIERGVPLEFESIFRAERIRWGFLKTVVYEEKRVARLQFQPLTRLFYVFAEGFPVEAFDDLTKALRACLVVKDWGVASSDQVFEGLELGLRLRLDENALPKPLLIGALTTADYQLTTGWLQVNYLPEGLLP